MPDWGAMATILVGAFGFAGWLLNHGSRLGTIESRCANNEKDTEAAEARLNRRIDEHSAAANGRHSELKGDLRDISHKLDRILETRDVA